jgi:hypothetical protein
MTVCSVFSPPQFPVQLTHDFLTFGDHAFEFISVIVLAEGARPFSLSTPRHGHPTLARRITLLSENDSIT